MSTSFVYSRDVWRRALSKFGAKSQILLFIEESAEATEAILHHNRGKEVENDV